MRLVIFLSIVLTISIIWLTRNPARGSATPYISVLVGSSPVTIWTWDTVHNTFIVLAVPSEYVASGADGYGRYSLEALWKLGFIDKKNGLVLSRSMEQLLAIRIPYYIGEQTDALSVTSDTVLYGKNIFSFRSTGKFFMHRLFSNMPLPTFIAMSWAMKRARLDALRMIDVREKSITVDEELSDGTKQAVLDPNRMDSVLTGVYADEVLAQEGITVAIYNTTSTPYLGTQAARMLTNLGIRVVAVGNAPSGTGQCEMKGREEVFDTKTAHVIRKFFDCTPAVIPEQERADVTVYLR